MFWDLCYSTSFVWNARLMTLSCNLCANIILLQVYGRKNLLPIQFWNFCKIHAVLFSKPNSTTKATITNHFHIHKIQLNHFQTKRIVYYNRWIHEVGFYFNISAWVVCAHYHRIALIRRLFLCAESLARDKRRENKIKL